MYKIKVNGIELEGVFSKTALFQLLRTQRQRTVDKTIPRICEMKNNRIDIDNICTISWVEHIDHAAIKHGFEKMEQRFISNLERGHS